MLLVTATQMADADTVFAGIGPSIRVVCINNLQQVASAALQFAQEHDEVIAFTQSNYVENLKAYVQDEKLFLNPKTGSAFSMNSQMENCWMGRIKSPGETVLFYTGNNGVLSFDYAGQAIIAFADGHVRSFRRDEITSLVKAKRLRWTP